ncbi:MAG TPA: tyrosine--tRNA ligase [Candidatus Sulfotelmatobacter sp.]|jgi:tyrosyl-tRNA synthetase|nr:tyrosine--tRNA ligase [Candidatus Sulfotelmatobacter sp.]
MTDISSNPVSTDAALTSQSSTAPRSAFLRTMIARGAVHQCSDWAALDDRLNGSSPVTAYIGFDATADSLHVGHLMSIMSLRRLQQAGHRPVVLMGGGTTRIGDPSFRDTSRPLLDEAQIAANIAGIRQVFARYLDFHDGPAGAVMINNADWLGELGYISFLRNFGRHFSVNRMLGFDSVKMRLEREQPLTFLEFNYMLLQAYDFVELSRRFGCCLQMGGSDQWGNIVNGIELGRRVDGLDLFGLTTTLLTTASGTKMGKTAQGAVWLNAERLPPYEFWQFWRNTEDADVGRFLRLFTDLPEDRVTELEALNGSALNDAKKILAHEVTTLLHGKDAARSSADTARKVFEEGGHGQDIAAADVNAADHRQGLIIIDALILCGLAASKGEARRLISGRGARVEGNTITDDQTVLPARTGQTIQLSAGKKRHAVIRFR